MVVDVSKIGAMFFVVLFVVAGATLRVDNLATGGALALIYILARFVGKSLGVLSLAHLSGIRPGSGGLLCLALTPMSGLAFGMVQNTVKLYPDFNTQLAAIVLSAALLLEVIGPLAVQFALKQAGEAGEER
jgi:Kef-type K+ transport system membrane component KefB